jgi:hypothetical protein
MRGQHYINGTMTYTVTPVTPDEKDRMARMYLDKARYEVKSEIYGCCIKLITDDRVVRDTWEENFFSMSQNVRSHGRLFVLKDPGHPSDTVMYDAYSKTLFLLNVSYYGWVKSLALSCAGDILEDEHGIFSVHGACVDVRGRGLCMAGTSGAGKTTQTYGLLTDPGVRVVADDWFFARVFGQDILAYGSERNFYIRKDLATTWEGFPDLVDDRGYDADGRAVADLRWVLGKGRLLPLTTLRTVVVLKRDHEDPEVVTPMSPADGAALFERNDYYNPHLLVRDERKTALRNRFIGELLARTWMFVVNTTKTPAETRDQIRLLAGLDRPSPQGLLPS